ncbi:MAG: hypothetical protein LBN71_06390, partial [Tannerella sp.]|nr:hypothetical protein [Tannerella sp.]
GESGRRFSDGCLHDRITHQGKRVIKLIFSINAGITSFVKSFCGCLTATTDDRERAVRFDRELRTYSGQYEIEF